jgi:hypothetical protein
MNENTEYWDIEVRDLRERIEWMDHDQMSLMGKSNYLVNETIPNWIMKVDEIEAKLIKLSEVVNQTVKYDDFSTIN